MISRRTIMLAGGMLPLLLAACQNLQSPGRPLPEDGTIDLMTLLSARPDTKIFTAALKRSGLDSRITPANGPATVFAPTDAAIQALPADRRSVLTDSSTDQAVLRAAVGGLVASGQLRLESIVMRNGLINTWTAGQQLRVTGAPAPTAKVQRAVLVNGRSSNVGPQVGFVRTDILASNGVIQVLDGALLP
ncbi:fasciclin domain-containing protein [Roseomonas marmotae]|uniref:Fasciclin domain-containing protein n=1 Tax=Roseomonas marmotae TaxID=2768161 RepID=A0ABS3KDD4_9PROT|nr:fasciclin domain-containing protein [Roseomonas marmotae]MBO1074346.1 fasciclin domain-containing protein [Roseomonas marmotae]QTI78096.1 fasciclin domain-containing protein [Roseomonas marmotae]